jgi:hypothetical protein
MLTNAVRRVAGPQVNSFMNDNWKEVYKSMSPAISEAFAQVIGSIVNTITSGLPYDALFPARGPSTEVQHAAP